MNLKDKRRRPLVKDIRGTNPLYNEGQITDRITNNVTGEIFTKVAVDTWRGTQGSLVEAPPVNPITSFTHPNLVAAYTMDSYLDGGAILADESVNGYNGTVSGATQADGVIGSSLDVGASADASFGPNILTGSVHTVAFWVNLDSLADPMFCGRYDHSLSKGLYFYMTSSGAISVSHRRSAVDLEVFRTATSQIPAGSWKFLVLGIDATARTAYCWLDGVPVAIPSIASAGNPTSILYDANMPFTIGSSEHTTGIRQYTDGRIDQFRAFNRILTDQEVLDLYAEGQLITSFYHDNLIAAYTMDGISGSTLLDASPNGNNGTIVTATSTLAGVIGDARSSGAISVPNSVLPYATDATICYWTKNNGVATTEIVSGAGSGSWKYICQTYFNGGIQLNYNTNNTTRTITAPSSIPNDGAYHLLCFVWRAGEGNLEIWLDGVLDTAVAKITGSVQAGAGQSYIMGRGIELATNTTGLLDHLRTFDRVLTSQEISDLYQEGIQHILSFSNKSLVAAYTMDNISGSTLIDESPNGYDATITGAVQTAGVLGNSLHFDKDDGEDFANAPMPAHTHPKGFTVCGWLQFDDNASVPANKGIWSRWGANSTLTSWLFHQTSSTSFDLEFVVYNGTTQQTVTLPAGHIIPDSTFRFYMIEFVPSTAIRIYRDNVLAAELTSSIISTVRNAAIDLCIGSFNATDPTNRGWDGGIDQFRYFDRTLSADEKAALFAEGAP